MTDEKGTPRAEAKLEPQAEPRSLAAEKQGNPHKDGASATDGLGKDHQPGTQQGSDELAETELG
jgi:hypothetical protein